MLLSGGGLSLLSGCSSTSSSRFNYEALLQKVYLAGVSFTGNFSHNKQNYPYSYDLSRNGAMDRAFVEELSKHKYPNLEITTELGNSKSSDAVAMSLGINLETVVTGKLGIFGYKTVIDVYAELFFFDFDEKKIINSVPINIQYITVTKTKPTHADIKELFRGLIFGSNREVKESLFARAATLLETIHPRLNYGTRYKVGSVDFSSEASSQIRAAGMKIDHFQTIAAQMFTRALAAETGVAVIPYTKGQAIGAKMAARFANGDAFTFDLPAADYAFNLSFTRLVSKRDSETSEVYDTEAYAVYQTVSFTQPDLNKVYLNIPFRSVTSATLQKEQNTFLSVAYLETVFDFYEAFAKDLKDPSNSWLKTVVKTDNISVAESSIDKVSELLLASTK